MTATVTYESNLRTNCLHLQSGSVFETDAPTDNKGKGERFSPTDLIATGLGACLITTMGIKAESMNIQLDGAKVEVTKVMVSDPRRIGKIIVHVTLPALNLDEKTMEILERVGRTCPVERSLHPDVELDIQFKWL
ncbi:MAG: OsmC family protein [Chitinophagaceae bacterium]